MTLLLVAAVILAAVLVWRVASTRFRLPCPSSFAWVLSNPYTNAVAGTTAVLNRAGIVPGMRVLDAGCGPGRITIPAAERVGPTGLVVALDVQEAMLDRVRAATRRQSLENVVTHLGGLESLELRGEFDRALLVTVLGEIPRRAQAMRVLFHSLKPAGLLSITEMIPDPHYQSRASVRRIAESVGFRVEHVYGNWLAYTMNVRKPEAM